MPRSNTKSAASSQQQQSLEEVISQYWKEQCDAHQLLDEDDEDGLTTAARAVRIPKDIQLLALNHGVSSLSVEATTTSSTSSRPNKSASSILTDLLVEEYIPACLAVAHGDAIDNDHVSVAKSILELIAAVALQMEATTGAAMVDPLVELAVEASMALAEPVRALACSFLGALKRTMTTRGGEDGLIPRLTDKSISVRGAAIVAAGQVLQNTSTGTSEQDEDNHTALLEALLWNVWHEPSVPNRVAALLALPTTTNTVVWDHVIARLLDVKEKVRLAAVQVLQGAAVDQLSSSQMAEIVQSGLGVSNAGSGMANSMNSRCQTTKDATIELICTHWMKSAKFNALNLLKAMDVLANEDEAEQVVRVLLDVADNDKHNVLSTFSPPEKRAFQASITNHLITLKAGDEVDGDVAAVAGFAPEQYFLARVAAATNETHLAKVVPDMGVLGDVFQQYSRTLLETIDADEKESHDRALFVCLQLLQLATSAGMEEEGSRRRFTTLLQALLTSSPAAQIPDELIEAAVKALLTLHGANAKSTPGRDASAAVTLALTDIVRHLSALGEQDEAIAPLSTLRILSILSIVLEEASPHSQSMRVFLQGDVVAKTVMEAVTMDSSSTSNDGDDTALLLREAGVSCLGKLGLFSDKSVLLEEYKPLLLKVAADSNQALTIRSQAMMALADWALVFGEVLHHVDGGIHLVDHVLTPLLESPNASVAAIAAEATAKLLFSNRLCDSALLAHLLVLFFDPNISAGTKSSSNNEEDAEDWNQVGSITRMQQWLSLFFPAYCLQSTQTRDAVLGSIESALTLALTASSSSTSNEGGKKKIKTKKVAFPIVKLVEYVCEVVSVAKEEADRLLAEQEGKDETERDPCSASSCHTALMVAAQVAQVLLNVLVAEEEVTADMMSLNATQLRGLCKLLGSLQVADDDFAATDASATTISVLTKLQQLLEELGMILTDGTALRALTPLTQELAQLDLTTAIAAEEEEDQDVDAPTRNSMGSNASTLTEAISTGETTMDDSVMSASGEGGKENAVARTSSTGTGKAAQPRSSTRSRSGLRSSAASSINSGSVF